MRELEYPFDPGYIIKKKKSIKRKLLESNGGFLSKKIAVLGGSTTHDIVAVLELFLLNNGIKPEFYESEYDKYWEDVMFDSPGLLSFKPDLIYIHTSNRNIKSFPSLSQSEEEVSALLDAEFARFRQLWEKIETVYNCPVIQNNFEYPYFRLLGNSDASNIHGRVSFINRLNESFFRYQREHRGFYVQDINYLSACYGLDAWSDPMYWNMYKYALSLDAVPMLSHNLGNMIKSIFGRNKKALALDLDNTLWGGIVGEDGADNLELSPETPLGEVYNEFQSYLKLQKDIGVILNICSKNDPENAMEGLNHRDCVLKPGDFIEIRANWEPKSDNLKNIAKDLSLLPESFVFVDDNPAERELVSAQTGAAAPDIDKPEDYIRIIDRSGFFEVTELSADDEKRNRMYMENLERAKEEEKFSDYGEYLDSLEMKASIESFIPVYIDRITQLTNKSNQFNLTTRRYSREEIEKIREDDDYLELYGRLEDKFGDNGVVSVVIGKKYEDVLNIELWLMSCRVLKRDMEYAMMDALVKKSRENGVKVIMGYYYKTAKNGMVKDFYGQMGFVKVSEDEEKNTVWRYEIPENYTELNRHISV
ncbi:MAG: HAD-IIIC family phosphatase [Lachnospiraceae bacterium]|nr:HAD-IIIC family phosphatase [Lachnospiraceae bacterium]